MKQSSILILALIIALCTSCACKKKAAATPTAGTTTENVETLKPQKTLERPDLINTWVLISSTPELVGAKESDESFTLMINRDGSINGMAVCNRYFGNYQLRDANNVTLSPQGATKMACRNNSEEQKFFDLLSKVTRYTITDAQLELYDNTGMIAVFALKK